MSKSTAIVRLGRILSGDLHEPELTGDTILIQNGAIREVGFQRGLDLGDADLVIDARGAVAAPGLIDSHVHIVFGDWTPRQNAIGWIDSYLHGGVTRMMSASEVHLPGRPTDPAGVKALALAAQRAFRDYRPGGVKVHAGSIILEPGLAEADFAELAREGVWLAKMGFGRFKRNQDAEPLIRAAQKHGFLVMCHTGGASIPSSQTITGDDLLFLRPDIAGHANGGTTALPDKDLDRLVEEAPFYLQISQAGNLRSALRLLESARAAGKLDRVLLSSDTPTGTGVMPLATLKSVVEMASLTSISAPEAWALATGNNADALRKPAGRIAAGKEADLLVIDTPLGSAFPDAVSAMEGGDLPGISAVLVDGIVVAEKSRNTPAPTRQITQTRTLNLAAS